MEKKCTRVYFTFLNGYESNYVGPVGNLARIPVDTSFVKLFTIDTIMHVFQVATSIYSPQIFGYFRSAEIG